LTGVLEFAKEFEEACKAKGITLYVNKPRCRKMNGYVERCHRRMREEFYQVRDYLPLTVHEIRKYLQLDDYYYNALHSKISRVCYTSKKVRKRNLAL
jgi:transposase InsO family protein